jgi:hypothetical protein
LQAKPVNSYMLADQARRYPELFLILLTKKCRSPASIDRSNCVGRPEQLQAAAGLSFEPNTLR